MADYRYVDGSSGYCNPRFINGFYDQELEMVASFFVSPKCECA